ncbi:hypothetical protein BGZ63DRAFT_395993 [Mariannaea sp. PMI_226]|nr:hypothetical protein BGZ63DRAFT_395993 [Mariannaea sp. PMI_226]
MICIVVKGHFRMTNVIRAYLARSPHVFPMMRELSDKILDDARTTHSYLPHVFILRSTTSQRP